MFRLESFSYVPTVARVSRQWEVCIPVRCASPYVQVHVGTERVKPGVILLAHDCLVLHVSRVFRGGVDGAAILIHVALRGPDGTKKSRHWRQASGACEVGRRADETGVSPGGRHAGGAAPGRRGAVVNEVRLNLSRTGEAAGVVHAFFWKGIVVVQFQGAVHTGKLAFTRGVPINETACSSAAAGPAGRLGQGASAGAGRPLTSVGLQMLRERFKEMGASEEKSFCETLSPA